MSLLQMYAVFFDVLQLLFLLIAVYTDCVFVFI